MRASPLGVFAALTLSGATIAFPRAALAQAPPPQPPPPTTYVITQPGYAPPAYYYPPPGYAPQQGYATLGPRTLDYDEGDPIPPGYHKATKARIGLVIGGSVTFGVFYLTSLFVAGMGQLVNDIPPKGSRDFGPLLIPFAGPFLAIGSTQPSTGGTFGLSLLGVAQTGGLVMFVSGLALPKTTLVRDDIGRPRLTVTPTVSAGGSGMNLTFTM